MASPLLGPALYWGYRTATGALRFMFIVLMVVLAAEVVGMLWVLAFGETSVAPQPAEP